MTSVFHKLWKILQNTTFIVVFVDVSAIAAAFVGTTVHQVSLWRTARNHRCVEVGRHWRSHRGARAPFPLGAYSVTKNSAKMHQNTSFSHPKSENFLGRKHPCPCPTQVPPLQLDLGYATVGRTPRLGSSTCLVLSWCVGYRFPDRGPSRCFICRSPWRGLSLWRGWERWRGLWLPTCFACCYEFTDASRVSPYIALCDFLSMFL